MIVAQLELGNRAHHPVRFDAAYCCDLQDHAVRRHRCARRTEHTEHPGARIGRAADDLQRLAAGIDGQHLQLVGLRMRRGAQHLGDAKVSELVGRVFDALDLKPDTGSA